MICTFEEAVGHILSFTTVGFIVSFILYVIIFFLNEIIFPIFFDDIF